MCSSVRSAAKSAAHIIVTILCDSGAKYQSRLFNKAWVAERRFPRRDRPIDYADCATSAGAALLNHASEACKDTTSPTMSSAGD
jgi:hypothetical protein